jgi:hypothetical protein
LESREVGERSKNQPNTHQDGRSDVSKRALVFLVGCAKGLDAEFLCVPRPKRGVGGQQRPLSRTNRVFCVSSDSRE